MAGTVAGIASTLPECGDGSCSRRNVRVRESCAPTPEALRPPHLPTSSVRAEATSYTRHGRARCIRRRLHAACGKRIRRFASQACQDEGVRHVFGYSGGANLPVRTAGLTGSGSLRCGAVNRTRRIVLSGSRCVSRQGDHLRDEQVAAPPRAIVCVRALKGSQGRQMSAAHKQLQGAPAFRAL